LSGTIGGKAEIVHAQGEQAMKACGNSRLIIGEHCPLATIVSSAVRKYDTVALKQ
jgi:hypothetical protein